MLNFLSYLADPIGSISVNVYSTEQNISARGVDLSAKIYAHAQIQVFETAYLFGGAGWRSKNVYFFNHTANSWQKAKSLEVGMSSARVVLYNAFRP